MDSELKEDINDFLRDLKKEYANGSFVKAMALTTFLMETLEKFKWADESSIKNGFEFIQEILTMITPNEPSFETVIEKFLKYFDEECRKSESLPEGHPEKKSVDIIADDVITEVQAEISGSRDSIASQAPEYIENGAKLLVTGWSKTVDMFLKYASKSRKFQVWVLKTRFKNDSSIKLFNSLRAHNIDVEIFEMSKTYQLIQSASMLITGAHAAMPNSGLMCLSGSSIIIKTAKSFEKTVIACVPNFKHTTREVCCSDQHVANEWLGPYDMISFSERHDYPTGVPNALYDFVPANYFEAIVTNV